MRAKKVNCVSSTRHRSPVFRAVHIIATWIILQTLLGTGFAQSDAASRPYLSSTIVGLEKQWPNNQTINLVFHGHSVPAGYAKTPTVNTFDSYPYLLLRSLKERYPYAVINVIVTAIGGENSVQGAKRFKRDVLGHHPDVLFIDYGLNDRSIGLDAAKRAWTKMIKEAQGHGIKVILLTPTGDSKANIVDPSDPLCLQAEQIRGLARRYGTGLVDSLKVFQKYVADGGRLEDLLAQSNHPNRRGNELVAMQILKYFVLTQAELTELERSHISGLAPAKLPRSSIILLELLDGCGMRCYHELFQYFPLPERFSRSKMALTSGRSIWASLSMRTATPLERFDNRHQNERSFLCYTQT